MKRITKYRIKALLLVAVLVVSVAVGLLFSFWWILAMLLVFYAALWLYIRYLTNIRDNARFDTIQGKALIRACNKRIEALSGYSLVHRFQNWF